MDEAMEGQQPADPDEVRAHLARFVGTWVGQGVGDYPTIDRFEYQEELRFELESDYSLLRYEQKTRLANGDPSHWEFGFLRCLDDLSIEVSNVQESGRVEVLRGTLGIVEEGLKLELESVALGNDPRLEGTRRSLALNGDRLHYTAHMCANTLDTPSMLPHLEAWLDRRE